MPAPAAILPPMRFLSVFAFLLAAACNSSAEIVPSPIPPGVALGAGASTEESTLETADDLGGARLDEILAVCEGEPLSLRQLVRRLGIPQDEAADEDNAEEIGEETREWVKDRLFVKAADRAGLKLPVQRVDAILEDNLQAALKQATEALGEEVTREKYLESKGLTYAEWRESAEERLLRDVYMLKLTQGLGKGSRPLRDMDVSPQEVRRIYRDHSKLFDVEAGLRMAQFEVDFDRFEEADPEGEFTAWERKAIQRAKALAAEFETGSEPTNLAVKYELGEKGEHWTEMPAGLFTNKSPDPRVTKWLQEPGRKRGDTLQVPVGSGIMIYGVLENRSARRVPFAEAGNVIEMRLINVRREYLRSELILQFLQAGKVVWPQSLADEIAEEAYTTLEKIAKDPIWAYVRLK